MSRNLSANMVAEKNKVSTSSAWLVFISITFTDSSIVRIVKNTEDMNYDGNKHFGANFEINVIGSNLEGNLPSPVLKVCNVGRLLTDKIRDRVCEDAAVKITYVNSKLLNEDYAAADMEYHYNIRKVEADSQWAYFTLGLASPLNRIFPPYRYTGNYCDYVFKEVECGYSGAETSCTGTFEDCVDNKNNGARFGGCLGIMPGSLQIA